MIFNFLYRCYTVVRMLGSSSLTAVARLNSTIKNSSTWSRSFVRTSRIAKLTSVESSLEIHNVLELMTLEWTFGWATLVMEAPISLESTNQNVQLQLVASVVRRYLELNSIELSEVKKLWYVYYFTYFHLKGLIWLYKVLSLIWLFRLSFIFAWSGAPSSAQRNSHG